MARNDDAVGAAILGGLVGLAIGKPTPEDQQLLNEARQAATRIQLRRQALGQSPEFYRLQADPVAYNVFLEAYNMYLQGFFRGSAVFSVAVIEHLLKKKYGANKFVNLIGTATTQEILSPSEVHYLTGLRIDRNDYLHEITKEVREEDAQLILKLTMKVIGKML